MDSRSDLPYESLVIDAVSIIQPSAAVSVISARSPPSTEPNSMKQEQGWGGGETHVGPYGKFSAVHVDLSSLLNPCGNFSNHFHASSWNSAHTSWGTTLGTTTKPSFSSWSSQAGRDWDWAMVYS